MKQLIILSLICIPFLTAGQNMPPIKGQETSFNKIAPDFNRYPYNCLNNINKYSIQNSSSLIALYDSIYNWEWDTLNNIWNYYSKTINIIYDAHNNLTSKLIQIFDSGAWVNNTINTFTFDANNNQTSIVYQKWNGSSWENYIKYTYIYNTNNNLTNEIYEDWDGSSWSYIYGYDYFYDFNNILTSVTYHDSGTNYIKGTYTYDANNNIASVLWQSWNVVSFDNYQLNTNTYDASNNLTVMLIQTWDGIMWVNWVKKTITYTANNNPATELHQNWDGFYWKNISQKTYSYDVNNFKYAEVTSYFGSGGHINSADSIHYYFHTVIGVNELNAFNDGLETYPNPFDKMLKLVCLSESNFNGEILLTDALGKIILKEEITKQETIFNTEKLSPGIYLLSYRYRNKTINKKLLKF